MALFIGIFIIFIVLFMVFAMAMAEWGDKDPGEVINGLMRKTVQGIAEKAANRSEKATKTKTKKRITK